MKKIISTFLVLAMMITMVNIPVTFASDADTGVYTIYNWDGMLISGAKASQFKDVTVDDEFSVSGVNGNNPTKYYKNDNEVTDDDRVLGIYDTGRTVRFSFHKSAPASGGKIITRKASGNYYYEVTYPAMQLEPKATVSSLCGESYKFSLSDDVFSFSFDFSIPDISKTTDRSIFFIRLKSSSTDDYVDVPFAYEYDESTGKGTVTYELAGSKNLVIIPSTWSSSVVIDAGEWYNMEARYTLDDDNKLAVGIYLKNTQVAYYKIDSTAFDDGDIKLQSMFLGRYSITSSNHIVPFSNAYYDNIKVQVLGDKASKAPSADEPSDDNTGGDNTGGDNTGGDNTGGDNTGGDNTGGDNTGGDNTGGDNTGGDNTGGDNTGGDNTGGDNTGGDNTGGDNTGGDNTGGDNTGGDNTGGDNTGDDNGKIVIVDEDYTKYTSNSDLVGWIDTYKEDGLASVIKLDIVNEGLKVERIDPEDKNSTVSSPYLRKILSKVEKKENNRTELTQTKFQGKYEIKMGISMDITSGYFDLYIGGIRTKISNSDGLPSWSCRPKISGKEQKLNILPTKNDFVVTYTIDTVNKTVDFDIDGTTMSKEDIECATDIPYIEYRSYGLLGVGSYFTIKSLQVRQIETEASKATLAVVNDLPEKLTEQDLNAVTENLTMPGPVDGVTWTSSDPATISPEGVVTRQAEDKDVVITATVDLGNNGGVFTKTYTMTVPKAEVPAGGGDGGNTGDDNTGDDNTGDDNTGDDNTGDDNTGDDNTGGNDPVIPPVTDDDLIVAYADFTTYSDIDDIPNITYTSDETAVVRAEKGKGIVIDQISSAPLVGEGTELVKVNGTAIPRLFHMSEAIFKNDYENRTNYRTNRFLGKYKITIEYETNVPSYSVKDGETEFAIAPYYHAFISSINPDTWGYADMLFMRAKDTAFQMQNSSSSGDSTLSVKSIKYTAATQGKTHALTVDINTDSRVVSINVDNSKTPSQGEVKEISLGYINGFHISSTQNMHKDSYAIIKSIKYEETVRNDDTAAAIAALNELPATLVENPYAVTENISLPYVSDSVVWISSDPAIISNDGTVTRWYDDREVTFTASSISNKAVVYKDYKLTVKAFDSYDKNVIMNNSGNGLSDVVESGDISMGAFNVSDNGIVVEKVVDGEEASAEQEIYYVDYRLFGEENAYNAETHDSILTSGYSGIYDVDFKVTPSISGDKPIYIALGSETAKFNKIISLRITKDNLAVVHKDGRTKVHSIAANDETFDIRYRIDTDNKLVWVFVNGKLTGSPFTYENVEFADSLRVILDKNNNKGDKVTVNNITVTEIVKNNISIRDELKGALNSITVSSITDSNATSVESIKALPSTVGEYDITWSSNNKNIDVVNSKVYFSESQTPVIVSATINNKGVYVKKNFYLTVRSASNNEEILDGYISDLPEVITKQNSKDIRYDLNLPLNHNGVSISWTSSKPQVIDNSGKINKGIAIVEATEVVFTANITMNGNSYVRTFNYTIAPRAFDNVVYTQDSGDVESITINGYNNIKITRDSVTKIKFSQAGNGTISFEDSNGKKIASIVINGDVYNVVYGSGVSDNYPIGAGEFVTLDVMVMPDINRLAVWNENGIIVDFGETLEDIDNLSKIDASDAISVSETKISTDEYGLLDINIANIGYFDIFAKNIITGSVDLVRDTVFNADVAWKSSDTNIITDAGVVAEQPVKHELVNMTLTLTSSKNGDVKRDATKKFIVACPSDRNYAKGKDTTSSVAEKPGQGKKYLTDGNYDTVYATSNANKKPVITIDFGKKEYFNTLFVNEDFANYDKSLKSYKVSYSNDGETWTVIKEGTINGIESALINFDTVCARYVSFTATECENKELYINEIEAYLFVDSAELVQIEIESLDFTVESSVTGNINLPKFGRFGTPLVWQSSHPSIISSTGVVTRPDVDTTVTLTVIAMSGNEQCSKLYAAFVPAKTAAGGTLVGGGSGSGGSSGGGGYVSDAGNGSALPGFAETDITDAPVVTETEFTDVDTSHWAYENIKKLNELGIVNGVGEGKFNPSGVVTREQFLKMLVEAVDIETTSTETDFDDIDSSSWYASYVAAGVNAGLVNGVTSTTFGVGSEIRRQDMAAMIVRILNNKNIVVTQTSEVFDDDSNISDYAKEAVYKVRDAGIIQGYAGSFNPMDSLTRAEAATVIIKLLEVLQ